ncbi:MAG: ABC transporter substrate-binding protein [Planctomycetota bacterium]|nr:MAG: ABC transporter substrate-binding protein [Planctomycetota bacterium]
MTSRRQTVRRRLGALAIAVAIGALAVAPLGCDRGGTAGGAKRSANTSTFVYARGADAVTLDPQKMDDGESVLVAANIFEGLVRYAAHGTEIEPALATSWEVSEDGLRWTFTLRKGVRFHDGSPCDAEAVVFTFSRIIDPKHPAHDAEILNTALYQDIERVQALDARHVRFTLRRALAPRLFLGNLTVYTAFIVPPGKLASREARDAFARQPIGTGPFVFERWETGQRIVLRRNEHYWGPKPAIERVVLLSIADNGARRRLLEAGEVHAIDGVNPIDVERLAKTPGVRVIEQPGMSVGYLAFNCRNRPLDDPRVRRAISLAIDREALVRLNFHGHAQPAVQICPPTVLAPPEGAHAPGRDLERARALLAEAGLEPGHEFTLWAMPIPRPYMPEPKKIAQLIKSQLAEIGLRCTIVTYPWDIYLHKTRQGEHDMCLLGWTADVADPDNFLFVFFHSANLGGTNFSFFSDPGIDTALLEAQTLRDPARRIRLYRRLERELAERAPLVPLVHPAQLAAVREQVRGFVLHPTGRKLFAGVRLTGRSPE